MASTQGSSLRHYFTCGAFFFWAFLLSLLSLAIRQSVSIDNDFWWHLKSGQYILQNVSIPHFDPFSFTKGGSEWVTHEWLSEVIMYATFHLTGWTGLLLLFGIIICASLGICYYRCEGKPFIAGLAVFAAALASAPLFGLRPQMITILLASVFLAVLDRHLIQASSRLLWLLPALMLLWVNLHAGFAMGLALILLFIVMAVLDKKWKKITPLLSILCLRRRDSAESEYVSDVLYRWNSFVSRNANLIQEWFSPDFHQVRFLPLAVLMLATFACLRCLQGEYAQAN